MGACITDRVRCEVEGGNAMLSDTHLDELWVPQKK
jgi:hypothetical protein